MSETATTVANGSEAPERAPALSGSSFPHVRSPRPDEVDGEDVLAGIPVPTDLSACLLPLLEALGWMGYPQEVAEALPHFVDEIDITALLNVMATLGYRSHAMDTTIHVVDPEELPCLFLPDDGDAMVIIAVNGTVEAFSSAEGRYRSVADPDAPGRAYFFSPVETGLIAVGAAAGDWFWSVGERFRGRACEALAITTLINLLALAAPLFVMAAYDRAIAAGSAATLLYLAVGAAVALAADLVLRLIRARILSFVGARIDNIIGVEVFSKILGLPAAMIERAAIGAQVARIRAFEAVRDFIAGPAAPSVLELPFTLLFITVVAYLGGASALVPIIAIAVAATASVLMMPRIGVANARAASAAVERQELMVETLGDMRAIKYLGAEETWLRRYRRVSACAAEARFRAALLSSSMETLGTLVFWATGFAVVAVGAGRVQSGTMTLGALVACLILAWRALAPVLAGMRSITQVADSESGIERLNDLMEIPPDHGPSRRLPPDRGRVKGQVTFVDVTMRYAPDALPALDTINFDIKGGKIVAVLGGNGAGKSTMLKLLSGLYETDEGSIMIDGRDIRDMDRAELRQLVSYVPQSPQFFYGTIAQNLRLAHPTASDEDLRWAARQAGALDEIEALVQGSGQWRRTGFDVRLGDSGAGQLSPGLLQRLSLARGYLKRSPVVLLDEPGNGLDLQGDQSLMRALANLRGERTVFIVTHRPSHLKMADRIIWLENGNLRAVGRSKVVMQRTGGKVI